jgi:hypothetical protein
MWGFKRWWRRRWRKPEPDIPSAVRAEIDRADAEWQAILAELGKEATAWRARGGPARWPVRSTTHEELTAEPPEQW